MGMLGAQLLNRNHHPGISSFKASDFRKDNATRLLMAETDLERNQRPPQWPPYSVGILAAAVVFLAVLAVDRLEQQRYDQVREARILRSLSNARARLEDELNQRLFLMQGIVAYVSSYPQIGVPEFQRLASVLLAQPSTA